MTLFHRPRWHRQVRLPLGEPRPSLFGHETDPVEDICMELRTLQGGHWSDHPCRCAELRIAYHAGLTHQAETGDSPVTAFVTEEARGWRHPQGEGWHRA